MLQYQASRCVFYAVGLRDIICMEQCEEEENRMSMIGGSSREMG